MVIDCDMVVVGFQPEQLDMIEFKSDEFSVYEWRSSIASEIRVVVSNRLDYSSFKHIYIFLRLMETLLHPAEPFHVTLSQLRL